MKCIENTAKCSFSLNILLFLSRRRYAIDEIIIVEAVR